jgi:hypothetical protein
MAPATTTNAIARPGARSALALSTCRKVRSFASMSKVRGEVISLRSQGPGCRHPNRGYDLVETVESNRDGQVSSNNWGGGEEWLG